ncbi:hypothetical protein LQ948_10080 [Jiella sp. MQZ9-1]|uniref:Uncharacterized protein n=1 Tax=Jiella flava TaxID=2816857 RepID=A0A939G0W9_9HYPH|nr:hypothetical protein [Jiella flava]MBO0663137.1 hypothetical protein [Jiella flava]MCD2471556.1 hypothetical protein [Jiella flava]
MAWMALGELFAILFGLLAGWYFLVYRDPVTGKHGRSLTGRPPPSADGSDKRKRRDE